MKKILKNAKSKIKSTIKKLLGIERLERRIIQLEERVINIDVGMQVDQGLRYLEQIKSTLISEAEDVKK